MLPSALDMCGRGQRDASLTYKAYDAANKRIEVTAVSCHYCFLLGQESFPRWFHHVHGHLPNENLNAFRKKGKGRKQIQSSRYKQNEKTERDTNKDKTKTKEKHLAYYKNLGDILSQFGLCS